MTDGTMHPLDYSVSEDLCDPEHREALQIHIDAALGEAPTVVAGKTYLVRGSYEVTDPRIARICLSGQGRNRGRLADLTAGNGSFEVTAQPWEVAPGRDDVLDLLMLGTSGNELGIRLRLDLKKNG